MYEKGMQAQVCYDDLFNKLDEKPSIPVIFNVNENQEGLIKKACFSNNPFPGGLKAVLLSLRMKAVKKLYKEEKVLQTGPAAAILALDAALAKEFGDMRDGTHTTEPVVCDVGFAGIQVIRLYMSAYKGNKDFIKSRYNSAFRVDNALNGSFYKYETADGRQFSAHVYYESQKRKMMETLNIDKDPDKFVFGSLVCFSDTVWQKRPGWAPCAEDITGLSVRNGSLDNPVNLNGVPLDYIPGMILFAGIMKALKKQATEGGSYSVHGSLTRGGYWLHECTDIWETCQKQNLGINSTLSTTENRDIWNKVFNKVEGTAVGDVYFPSPATYTGNSENVFENMQFSDGNSGFNS